MLAGVTLVAGIAGCSRSTPETHEVPIRGFAFEPATLVVVQGDTVVWSNHDIVPHTATDRKSVV